MKSKFVQSWVKKAEKDEFVLRIMLPLDKAAGHACFLSQQIAEKYLKAYLAFQGKLPPKTHQLNELVSLCSAFSSEFLTLEKQAAWLSTFYIITRYPSELPDPTLVEAKKAFKIALKFKTLVLKKMD